MLFSNGTNVLFDIADNVIKCTSCWRTCLIQLIQGETNLTKFVKAMHKAKFRTSFDQISLIKFLKNSTRSNSSN